MRTGFKVGGVLSIVFGGALLLFAIFAGGPAALGLGFAGASLALVGMVFLVVSKFLTGLDPTEILRSGAAPGETSGPAIPAIGQILWTRDTGVILNNVNLVVQVGLRIEHPNGEPYDAETRHVMQGRNQWGALQPGMTVPVLINPNDKSKVVIDSSRPVVGNTGMGAASVGGRAQVVVKSAMEIVNAGTKSTANLVQVAPTGMTAGQAKAGLPAEQADDPISQVVFTYLGADGTEYRSEIMVRVPDGKGHALQAGAVIPIVYLPDNPGTATIDWDLVPPAHL